jgi:REP element-mobilizing transposase RayT
MNSFTFNYLHIVFSTKDRVPLIEQEIEQKIYKYIAGIARNLGIPILKIGGMSDHIHILLMLPPTISLSKAMHKIKGSSSRWINKQFFDDARFKWQGGYSAFSVSISNLEKVKQYIEHQKVHHQYYSYEEEYRGFLRRHNIFE